MPDIRKPAPWSPLPCESGPNGMERRLLVEVVWRPDIRAYYIHICPQEVDYLMATSRPGTVRIVQVEKDVKRYSSKRHAEHAANVDKQDACKWAAHVGYNVKPFASKDL